MRWCSHPRSYTFDRRRFAVGISAAVVFFAAPMGAGTFPVSLRRATLRFATFVALALRVRPNR